MAGVGSGGADILFRAEVDATGAIISLKALGDQAGATGQKAGGAASGISGFGESILSLKKVVAGAAVAAGLYKLTDWMSETIKLAGESQAEQVKLEAMLRATGGAVGLTASQLDAMATSLSRSTGIDDELVKSAESLLLTFRNVGSEAFQPTMKAAADLAAVTGMDLRSAVETLGRALEDPAAGMDRLRRAGIVLSDQVKAQIKDLQEHGQQLEAQKLLLAEVQARVGGLSDAMGGTFKMSLEKVRNEWSNVREEIGGFLTDSKDGVGILNDLSTVLGKIADEIKDAKSEDKATGQTAASGMFGLLSSMVPGLGGAASNVQMLATALGAAATKIREADAAAIHLASSHDTLGKSASNVATLSDTEKKKLDALLNALDPVRKATGDYNENVKLLGEALAAGEITQGQYNDALKASKDALDKVREASGLLLPEMAKLPGTNVLKGFSDLGDEIRNVEENFRQLLPQVTSLYNSPYASWIVSIDTSKAKTQLRRFSDEQAKAFGDAFKDGFLKAFEGKGLTDAWLAVSDGLAGMFAKSMGDTLSALFQGKPLTGKGGALEAGGLWNPPTKDNPNGSFDWAAAAGMLGGAISSVGAAKNNQSLAALGGALSGGVAGGMVGGAMAGSMGGWNWVGAAIGAVIGGVMGYFSSSGMKSYGYNLYAGNAGAKVNFGYGGPDTATMADMSRQLNDTVQTTTIGFRDLLKQMDQGFANPVLGRAWTGSTKDAGSIFKTILESEAPRLVLTAFEPYLKQGLTSLGVSDTRAASELASFDSGKFDAALAAFKAWVTAITSLNDVSTLLGSTPDELRAKVNMTLRDSFLAGFDDVMKQAGDLTSSLDQMFSQEQVTNAQSLLSIAQDQYQAGLQYFSQLEQVSKSLAEQTSGVLLGFDEQRAKDKGPAALASFYETQLSGLQGQLGGATSVEQVQQIMSQILQYGQELWAITGQNQPRNTMSQEDVEQFIRDSEKKAQDEIAVWEKEVADRNAALKAEVDLMTTALTSATTATQNLTDSSGALVDSLTDAAGAGRSLRDSLDQAVAGLDAFTASLSGGAAVQGWA